jgi:hypothetical protein
MYPAPGIGNIPDSLVRSTDSRSASAVRDGGGLDAVASPLPRIRRSVDNAPVSRSPARGTRASTAVTVLCRSTGPG